MPKEKQAEEFKCEEIKQYSANSHHYELTLIIIEIISFFLAGLLSRHFFIAITIFVIIIILTVIILSPNDTAKHFRSKIVNFFSQLLWEDLLQLNQAKAEFLFWRYENSNKIKRYASLFPRDYFIQYKNVKIITKIDKKLMFQYPDSKLLEIANSFIPKHSFYWNNKIYRLGKIYKDQNSVKLVFGLGCYNDFVTTCEVIGQETLYELKKHKLGLLRRRLGTLSDDELLSLYQEVNEKLPLRRKVADTKDELEDPRTKTLKMGINNVTLFYDQKINVYRFLLARRSSRILEYPNTYHVVPAGTFEPILSSSKKSSSLESEPLGTVLRELYEECFLGFGNEQEITGDKYPSTLDIILKKKEIKPIYDNLEDPDKVEFHVMGIYFDYFVPKVEMTTCLVIHDPQYLQMLENNKELVLNWEYGSKLLKEPFTKDNINKWINSKKLLPIGAVALEDAVDICKNLLKP